MKKIRLIQWLSLLLAGALLLGFAACHKEPGGPTEPFDTTAGPLEPTTVAEPPTTATAAAPGFWNIEIRGVPNIMSFNSQDAQYLPKVQVEMISTNLETGLASRVTYGGVTLRSLLMSFCGVQAVSSVTVTSINGASAVYNPVMAMAEDTILAWEVDGAPIDADPPLRMCPKSGTAEMLVRQVSSINVIIGVPETTLPTYTAIYTPPPMGHTNDYNYTTTTRWSTYPASVSGIDPPTAPPPTNPDGTPVTTTEPTTATTTTTTTTTTRTYTKYTYVQPTTVTRTTSSTRPTLTPPEWWPPDVPYYG
jgi:hypothetical protein